MSDTTTDVIVAYIEDIARKHDYKIDTRSTSDFGTYIVIHKFITINIVQYITIYLYCAFSANKIIKFHKHHYTSINNGIHVPQKYFIECSIEIDDPDMLQKICQAIS